MNENEYYAKGADNIVRQQYKHAHMDPEVLDWFHLQYPRSGFNGRFQIGYRKLGERGVWPLFTGDLGQVEAFLEDMHISQKQDYYITANAVSGVKRRAEELFSLHNIVVDIDAHFEFVPPEFAMMEVSTPQEWYISGVEPDWEAILFRLERDLDPAPPLPSSVVFTGRGCQLWWAITPMSSKCLTWWQEAADTLVEAINHVLSEYSEFDGIRADSAASRNAVGYFRLPGTENTVAGRAVKVKAWTGMPTDTHKLIPWAKAWKEQHRAVQEQEQQDTDRFAGRYLDSDIYIMKDFRATAFFRVRQLIQLRLLRDNDVGEETRNNMCFIAYNAMLPSMGHDKAWDKLLLFNQGFKAPMTEKELHQTVNTAHKKGGYRYKNETLLAFLGVTAEEQAAIGLYEPALPYSQMTRLANHPSRRAAAKAVKEDRNRKIQDLASRGLTQAKIAKELGIDSDTVSSVLRPLKPSKADFFELLSKGALLKDAAAQLGVPLRTAQNWKKKETQKTEKMAHI